MNFDELKRKGLNFVCDQLPVVAKLLKLEPEEYEDPDEEYEEDEEFEPSEAIVGENEIESFEPDDELEEMTLEEEEGEEGKKAPPLTDQEKKERNEKYKKLGIRGLAAIAILYVFIDDVLLKKDPPSDNSAQTEQVEAVTEQNVLQDEIKVQDSGMDTTNFDPTSNGDEKTVDEFSEPLDNIDTSEPAAQLDTGEASDLIDSSEPVAEPVKEFDNIYTENENKETQDNELENTEPLAEDDGLDTTNFDKSGYENPVEVKEAENTFFEEQGYTDITADDLESELKEKQAETPAEMSPQDQDIEGVSLGVLRELEEKLKQKEKLHDQNLLGDKEDLSFRGQNAPVVDFMRIGRGLIINCAGGHFACVDEISYNDCRLTQKINRANRVTSTCEPYNVYLTEKDCERAQYEAMEKQIASEFCK